MVGGRKYSVRSRKRVPPPVVMDIDDARVLLGQIQKDMVKLVLGEMGPVGPQGPPGIGTTGPTGSQGEPYPDMDGVLKEWTQGKDYEPLTINYDVDGNLLTAGIKWPDGTTGGLTMANWNPTHEAWDGYSLTHPDSGKTVTQTQVTRNADGAIINKPELTVI